MRREDRHIAAVVYQAVNLLNGNRYIGITSKSIRTRQCGHFGSARRGVQTPFCSAIRKYGEDFFRFSLIARCRDYSKAMAMERRLIAIWRPEYNATTGGDGVPDMPDAVRKKIGDAARGRRYANRKSPPDWARENLSRIGKQKNDEWQRDYARLGPAASARAVICVTDGRTYESASAAARAYGVARSALIELCLGKRGRKTVGGLAFAYLEGRSGCRSQRDVDMQSSIPPIPKPEDSATAAEPATVSAN
jgi:hypothetical protein